MPRANYGFTLFVLWAKKRLLLHRSVRDLQTALELAVELGRLRPKRLDGLFIADAAGATWSVRELVDGPVERP